MSKTPELRGAPPASFINGKNRSLGSTTSMTALPERRRAVGLEAAVEGVELAVLAEGFGVDGGHGRVARTL